MGTASTLLSPAGEYLSYYTLDPSGRVAALMTAASSRMTLVNLDAPAATMTIADERIGVSSLTVIAPRWVPVLGFLPLPP